MAPTHPGFKGLEVHQAHNLSFGTSLFFFFHFVPEGLPGSVMTTEAADLRDCPRRRKRTDVHRHIAENAASNSWGSDRLQSGWPPHGGDVNLKEQPLPLICSWLFFSATGKKSSGICSCFTLFDSRFVTDLEKTKYLRIHQNNDTYFHYHWK